jgi:dTDP-4-amino-4,6-dideoxygalactose transaminase
MSPNIEPMKPFIPFARPSIGAEEERAVLEVLRSGWLTTGSRAEAFERAFAARVGAKAAIAVNSCTAGLHLALEAFGIGPGKRVATTTWTFTATAEVIRYLGAEALLVDIAEESYQMDVAAVESLAERSQIDAIIAVHIGGEVCPMDELNSIAGKHHIPVIEDAAHAFPSMTASGYAGTLGNAGVYSFYANKTITTGEGGMVVIDDPARADRIRTMRLHGIDRSVWDRYTTSRNGAWEYDVVAPGYKYNLPDIAAAIGLEQLAKADAFLARRKRIALRYSAAFGDRDYLVVPRDGTGHAWHLYILAVRPELLSIDRNEYLSRLTALGIGTSVHYKPLHLMSYYRTRYGLRPESFPRATARFERVMSLPIYPDLDDDAVERIIESVLSVGDAARRPGS